MKIRFGYHERMPKALIGKTGKLHIFGGRDAKPCVITLHVPAYPVGYFLVEDVERSYVLSQAEGAGKAVSCNQVDAYGNVWLLGHFASVGVYDTKQKPAASL